MKVLKSLILAAVCFSFLATMSFADEIEDLKRKLEYLESKALLDSELELLQAQIKNKHLEIKKLDSDYKDVITATPKEETVSPQSEPVTESETVETATPVEVASREWAVKNLNAGTCQGWKIGEGSVDISADGTFSWEATNRRDGWKGSYNGNLRDSTGKCEPCGNNARVQNFESEQVDGNWNVKLAMAWGGGGCRIAFTLE